jgi:predicted enzyme related to lactoylglutathione lyase
VLERDGYPPGVPCWIDTGQPDPQAAARFYGALFEWEFEDRMPVGSPGEYLVARLDGRAVAAVGSQMVEAQPTPVWSTYIWVASANDTAAAVSDAGGSVLVEPFDVTDAGRMGVLSDPSGAVFCVWEANRHRGAQLVNVAGTWNWSDLNTRDPEGAETFYGEVFGWIAQPVDFGDQEATMWRVPGYGDHLEQRDPDLLRRQADAGAPEGFEDAIGWMTTMTAEQFPDDVPPHWSVTFAVDDPDATADRAAELGGAVLMPPFDADVVRIAVLRDPQGAVFTVSRYEPPQT